MASGGSLASRPVTAVDRIPVGEGCPHVPVGRPHVSVNVRAREVTVAAARRRGGVAVVVDADETRDARIARVAASPAIAPIRRRRSAAAAGLRGRGLGRDVRVPPEASAAAARFSPPPWPARGRRERGERLRRERGASSHRRTYAAGSGRARGGTSRGGASRDARARSGVPPRLLARARRRARADAARLVLEDMHDVVLLGGGPARAGERLRLFRASGPSGCVATRARRGGPRGLEVSERNTPGSTANATRASPRARRGGARARRAPPPGPLAVSVSSSSSSAPP